MEFNISATQEFVLRIGAIKDSKGNLAQVDGPPVWATDNTDLVALSPAADGMSCRVRAIGVVGSANVQATADADIGPGVDNIIGVGQVNIGPGKAKVMELAGDAPTEQP